MAYAANASIAGLPRQRRGAALCSVKGNWYESDIVIWLTCLIQSQLCNKCGLFERTHSAPRPKSFPRRRRSRPSVHPRMNPPAFGNEGHYRLNDPLQVPNIPSSSGSHFPDAFGTGGEATTLRDMPWTTYDIPHAFSTPSHMSAYHVTAEQQSIYHTDIQSSSTVPTLATCTPSPSRELLSHAN